MPFKQINPCDVKDNFFGRIGADWMLVRRKLYRQAMTENSFVDAALVKENCPGKDFHRVYVGEVEAVFTRV